jgi:hypothetical protein
MAMAVQNNLEEVCIFNEPIKITKRRMSLSSTTPKNNAYLGWTST